MKRERGRRGRGEGAIWQLDDGTWCGQISLGGSGRRRKRKNYRAATKQKLIDAMAGGRVRQSAGNLAAPSSATVGEYLTHWLTTIRTAVAGSTADSYQTRLTE